MISYCYCLSHYAYHSFTWQYVTMQRSPNTHPPVTTKPSSSSHFVLRQNWRIKKTVTGFYFSSPRPYTLLQTQIAASCSILSKWLTWSGFCDRQKRRAFSQTMDHVFLRRAAYPVASFLTYRCCWLYIYFTVLTYSYIKAVFSSRGKWIVHSLKVFLYFFK